MKNRDLSTKKIAISYVGLTLLLTWVFQFMPIFLGMNVQETSISSFDYSAIFFGIGGCLPSVIGTIFVLALYKKENVKDFLKRCFVPTKRAWMAIAISLVFICFESFVVQSISKLFGGSVLGFEGLKLILHNPLMFFYFLFWGLISGPLSEEVGWRGFLSDMIVTKENIFKSTILIGLIWGIWHLPLFFYPAQIQYEWAHTNFLLVICFVFSCVTNALVYSAIYVISGRRVFSIFFLHMFENIILTGAMIYPFSDVYKVLVNPVTIVIDIAFYLIITRTKLYKGSLEKAYK